jgi:hypothetical protein
MLLLVYNSYTEGLIVIFPSMHLLYPSFIHLSHYCLSLSLSSMEVTEYGVSCFIKNNVFYKTSLTAHVLLLQPTQVSLRVGRG